MRKFVFAAAVAVFGGAVFGVGAAVADPVEGIWMTKPDDNGNFGHVQIKACGAAFCGKLIKAFDGSGKVMDSPNVGKMIVWDMVAYPDGLYDDGKIWSPDRDKTYDSDMRLSGKTLKVRGCIIGFCRDGGTWTRVN